MSRQPTPRRVAAGQLLQHVSRSIYRGTALHFGRTATNRYDDPQCAWGVLYLGFDLATALMESLFHRHQWLTDPGRGVALQEVQSRIVRAVGVLEDVHLADLTAPGVMAACFGLNLEQLASRDYTHTQRISSTIHAMRTKEGHPLFDGILYPSRNNYPGQSIALFERAKAKVCVVADIDLTDHTDWPHFVATYEVAIIKP